MVNKGTLENIISTTKELELISTGRQGLTGVTLLWLYNIRQCPYQ